MTKEASRFVKELLFDCNWNATTPEAHISKVVCYASWGTSELVAAIRKDVGAVDATYMRHMAEVADEVEKLSSVELKQAIEEILDGEALTNTGIRFNAANYRFLRSRSLDLLPSFDSDFHGDIQAIWDIPFTSGNHIITRTCKNGQTAFYVSKEPRVRETPARAIEARQFQTFDDAVAFCICPAFHQAIAALIRAG
jgi:hypothetical protein